MCLFTVTLTYIYNKPKDRQTFRFSVLNQQPPGDLLLLLVPVLSQTLFTLVSGHLMSLSLFSAWHTRNYYLTFAFTLLTNAFAGLNAGILCAGIIIVVFLEIFLAVF